MAKDTEKLIRQLSLISYLMAERRPVAAQEIRSDVEGYSGMNEDAFARRFYADRAELEALGIDLVVERPADGQVESETYALPPENFHLEPIAFTDEELAALQTSLALLDGKFAYAAPLRLALQQISWGRPSPLAAPEQRAVKLGITASAGGHELSQRLAKVEAAIFRRKTIVFDYYTLGRDEVGARRVDPYQLLFQGGQFYLVGHAHERDDIRVFRLSRIRGKVAFATKAEHDFQRPEGFDPRAYADRVPWQFGEIVGRARIRVGGRIAWQVERLFGRHGRLGEPEPDGARVFETDYAASRELVSWVLGLGEHAELLGPPELVEEARERLELLRERHAGELEVAPARAGEDGAARGADGGDGGGRRGERADGGGQTDVGRPGASGAPRSEPAAIRPERFARLVTLASVLIDAGRRGERVPVAEVCERLQLTPRELREDLQVLNVVNFGAGAYVLYAEVDERTGEIEVDPEPYSDSFARPARLLPVEAKALVAAIDLLGDHLPAGSLQSARSKIVAALGEDPAQEGLQVVTSAGEDRGVARAVSTAIERRRVIELLYYKENEDEFSTRRVEPYALANGREGWYVIAYDPSREGLRHFRLDRVRDVEVTDEPYEPRRGVDPMAEVDEWLRTGEVQASRRARVWVSPERARWVREERPVLAELEDGAIVVEVAYAGTDWLVREVLKEAGDLAVLAPDDARDAVRRAAERLLPEAAGAGRRGG